MTGWKYIVWFLLLYPLVIIQASFLPHLSVRGVTPDLIFIVIFLWIFLFPKEKKFIYILSIAGGLLLENYSILPFFGLSVVALLLIILLVKKLGSVMQGFSIFSLLIIFSAAFLCFKFIPAVSAFIITLAQKRVIFLPLTFSWKYLAISWGTDLIIVVGYFYFYELFYKKKSQRN